MVSMRPRCRKVQVAERHRSKSDKFRDREVAITILIKAPDECVRLVLYDATVAVNVC
jgi:hypothetical protein